MPRTEPWRKVLAVLVVAGFAIHLAAGSPLGRTGTAGTRFHAVIQSGCSGSAPTATEWLRGKAGV